MQKSLALLLSLAAEPIPSVEAARPLPLLLDGAPRLVKSPDDTSFEMTPHRGGTSQIKVGPISKDSTRAIDSLCIGGMPLGTAFIALSTEELSAIETSPEGMRLVFLRI